MIDMSENTPEQTEDLRSSVAAELRIPDGLAQRLIGTTREELLADAAVFGYTGEPIATRTPNPPSGGLDPEEDSGGGWSDRQADQYARSIRAQRLSF